MKNKKLKLLVLIIPVFVISALWIACSNKALTVNEITVSSLKIPDAFDGLRIVHVSDLHNAEFGKDNETLLSKIKESDPDIILITGDLIDSRRTDLKIGISFASEVRNIAPVYYVSGNHEARIEEYPELEAALTDCGVTVLNNESAVIEREGEFITLYGIKDPNFDFEIGYEETVEKSLQCLKINENTFNILMAHHPEFFESYVSENYDLVFSGHAHGGQIRLPFIGGIIAPGQGLFPKYDSGVYSLKNTSMIVSRGIGNSLFPFRVNNRPEIIAVELNKTEIRD